MERVFSVCLILILAGSSIGELRYSNSSNQDTLYQFELFDTPYANLPADGIEGYLYYSEIQCNSTFPQALSFYDNYSYLLVDDYDTCILQRIALAKQAGYDCLLTYTVDDSVSKVSDAIFNTGFPVAIIKNDLAQKIKDSLNDTSCTDYMLSVSGDITGGIAVVSISSSLLYCLFCIIIFVAKFYHFLHRRTMQNAENRLQLETQTQIRREELIESILRQLQAMEDGIEGRQMALGQEQTRLLPETTYQGEEGKEMCSICVDEFVNGVSIKTLPCNHIFHSECIDEWLGSHSSLCPLCKLDLRQRLQTS